MVCRGLGFLLFGGGEGRRVNALTAFALRRLESWFQSLGSSGLGFFKLLFASALAHEHPQGRYGFRASGLGFRVRV